MANERFMVDANTRAGGAIGGYSSADAIGADNPTLIVARFDPTTGRLLVDVNGATLVSDGDAVSATNDGYLVLGTDGSNYQVIATDASGHLQVDVLSGGGGTQYTEADTDTTITGTAIMWEDASDTLRAVSAAKPLPVSVTGGGDATAANQTTIIGHVDGIEGLLTTIDVDTSNISTKIDTIAGAVAGTEMQVDVVTSALPTGASTSAKQDTIIGHVDGIEGLLTTIDADTSALSALILATQADDVVNTSDGLQTTSFLYVFDGTTWDRLRGDATNGMLVNLGSNNDVTVTGTVAVTQSGTWDEVGINDSGNSITVDYATTGSGVSTGALRVELPTNGTGVIATVGAVTSITNPVTVNSHAVTNAGTFAVQESGGVLTALQIMDDWDNGASDGASVSGDVAHDTADAGEPVKIGMKAVALKTNPTEVAANDRTNWYADVSGIPFVLPGHMNTLTQSLQVTDADGAQTDAAIITAGANVAVVVTKVSVMADGANTGDVAVRIGFGTANTPAADAAQMLLFHPGIKPGSGVVEGTGGGILGIGASGEDVRVTCEDPAGGSINIIVTYFTTDI